MTTPTSGPEAVEKERRANRLTVGVALIAAMAGLFGSTLGAGITYLATTRQIEAQRQHDVETSQQAREDRLREKRQQMYGEVSAALEWLTRDPAELENPLEAVDTYYTKHF